MLMNWGLILFFVPITIVFDKPLIEILGFSGAATVSMILIADSLSSINSEYYEKGKLVKDRG